MMNKRIQKNEFVDISMNRKGQGISINVVIIAAIAMLVLIILAILIGRSGGELSKGTGCISKGGVCKLGSCSLYSGGPTIPDGVCSSGYTCCSPV